MMAIAWSRDRPQDVCLCVCVSTNVILHRPSTWPPPTPLTNRQFMIMYIHFARWFNHFCCQRFHTHNEHCSFVWSMNKIIERKGEWMLFDPTFHYCCCLSCIRRYVASIVTHATTLVLLFMCWWRWTTLCVLHRWFGCLCLYHICNRTFSVSSRSYSGYGNQKVTVHCSAFTNIFIIISLCSKININEDKYMGIIITL